MNPDDYNNPDDWCSFMGSPLDIDEFGLESPQLILNENPQPPPQEEQRKPESADIFSYMDSMPVPFGECSEATEEEMISMMNPYETWTGYTDAEFDQSEEEPKQQQEVVRQPTPEELAAAEKERKDREFQEQVAQAIAESQRLWELRQNALAMANRKKEEDTNLKEAQRQLLEGIARNLFPQEGQRPDEGRGHARNQEQEEVIENMRQQQELMRPVAPGQMMTPSFIPGVPAMFAPTTYRRNTRKSKLSNGAKAEIDLWMYKNREYPYAPKELRESWAERFNVEVKTIDYFMGNRRARFGEFSNTKKRAKVVKNKAYYMKLLREEHGPDLMELAKREINKCFFDVSEFAYWTLPGQINNQQQGH